MLENIFVLLLVLILVFFVGLTVTHGLILRDIKKNHNSVWVSLGEPSFFNNSISNGIRVTKFLFKTGCRELGDKKLEKWCGLYTKSIIFYLVCLCSEILIFFLLVRKG